MDILKILFVAAIAYLIGNFHNAYIIGKVFRKIDIREHGSKNCGATNAVRVLGGKLGLMVFVGDVIKAVIAVLIGRWLIPEYGGIIAGAFVVLGHDFPVFLQFKGGKGIASTFGVMLILHPWIALIALASFIIITITTKYVSLASMISITLAPILLIITRQNIVSILLGIGLCILAIFQHRANIKRLLNGTEKKIIKG